MEDENDKPHSLAIWLKETGTPHAEFALRIGVSPSHLSCILKRSRGVSLEVALDIERCTAGRVTARDCDRREPNVEVAP